ncbi:BatD family protein [Capnocytophaga sputigena]|jgi:batD protein|uniref:BatD family protein n=1 Tax=Capnocytophaga sputigena TaxID=1019 RepID=UPI000BB1DEB5|nr:BatD family protein [Capnocytophaga sputigena]ATA69870.1 BatD protein [Capnocytophaga sputigena]VEI52982.1 Uncharacterised protein [Capnocytophaga sputigena]
MKYKIIFFITFLIQSLYAQQVEFKAEVSKNQLGANERLRIEFSMNKDGDNFTPPNFHGFTVVMGPSQSISKSWINGVSSFSKTYVYILEPKTKGNFTIGQASIEIDGRTYRTNPINITVTDAVKTPTMEKNSNDYAREGLFLLTEISNPNPYLNEAVIVTYRLYVGRGIAVNNFQELNTPKYPEFWSQEIRANDYQVEERTYKGQVYRTVVMRRKMILYPQKTGSITLEPLNLNVLLTAPTGQRDFFGGLVYESMERKVSSGSAVINVKPLPEQGKPDNFSGAVGDFSFAVNLTQPTLKANESTQLKIEISGNGNFKLFDLPKPNFPSSLEVYAPEQKDDVLPSLNSGMKGRLEQTYTIVPEYKGKYPISGLSFSYFNPKTQKYETVKTNDLWIDVTEGPTPDSDTTANEPTTAPKTLGGLQMNADFQDIHTPVFFGSTSYYLWLFLPLLLIPIALIWWHIRMQRASDVEGNKVRAANRLAKKYLGEAKRKLGDKNTFYEALERALHNYLKAKLKIETAEMSKDKITELLLNQKANEATVTQFMALLANCEMARYSQHHTDASMEKDFGDAVEVISALDKQVKNK